MTFNSATTDPIIVESQFEAGREDLWQAITDRSKMVQWFFEDIPDFRPEVGFETSFNISAGDRDYFHLWKITEVISGKKIVYDWRYKEIPGEGIVTFELIDVPNSNPTDSTDRADRVKLKVVNEGLDTFPNDVPEFTVESCVGGWNYFINERLRVFIEGK